MGQTKFKPLVLDEAQEDTKGLRRYILKNFAAQTSEKTPAELTVAFANIRQFPQSGSAPAELSDFGGLNLREVLSGQNRVIYEVRDDAIYAHVVTVRAVTCKASSETTIAFSLGNYSY